LHGQSSSEFRSVSNVLSEIVVVYTGELNRQINRCKKSLV